jgi:hypothetical protein
MHLQVHCRDSEKDSVDRITSPRDTDTASNPSTKYANSLHAKVEGK